MRLLSFIFFIIILLIGISFALLNHHSVKFYYYLGEETLPLSFLLVLFFISGALIGLAVGCWMYFKLKLKNYRLQHQLKLSEKEIQNIRSIPLQDRH